MKHQPEFSTTVCGIPCGVVVDHYHKQKPFLGSPQLCESADDYYGYTEMEWYLIDRNGYVASWLRRKMTEQDIETLEIEIGEHYDS